MTLAQLLHYYYVGSAYEIELAKLNGVCSVPQFGSGIGSKPELNVVSESRSDLKAMLGGM
jgi:hypothetical protein